MFHAKFPCASFAISRIEFSGRAAILRKANAVYRDWHIVAKWYKYCVKESNAPERSVNHDPLACLTRSAGVLASLFSWNRWSELAYYYIAGSGSVVEGLKFDSARGWCVTASYCFMPGAGYGSIPDPDLMIGGSSLAQPQRAELSEYRRG